MEKLVSRLIEIKEDIKSNGSKTQVLDKLRSLIKDVSKSKCDNGDFCGMDKKW